MDESNIGMTEELMVELVNDKVFIPVVAFISRAAVEIKWIKDDGTLVKVQKVTFVDG